MYAPVPLMLPRLQRGTNTPLRRGRVHVGSTPTQMHIDVVSTTKLDLCPSATAGNAVLHWRQRFVCCHGDTRKYHRALVAKKEAVDLSAAVTLEQMVDRDQAAKSIFTADSVLTCPVGVTTCTPSTITHHQGAIAVYIEGKKINGANDWLIYAKGFGNTEAIAAQTPGPLSSFTFIGRFSDYNSELSAGKTAIIDLSVIMPDTRYALQYDASTWSETQKTLFFNWFTTAECLSINDITAGAQSFNNLDAENIECSGRGECDRSSGVCACFDGYTGLACGEQTILI